MKTLGWRRLNAHSSRRQRFFSTTFFPSGNGKRRVAPGDGLEEEKQDKRRKAEKEEIQPGKDLLSWLHCFNADSLIEVRFNYPPGVN